jgi:hypothetical protein
VFDGNLPGVHTIQFTNPATSFFRRLTLDKQAGSGQTVRLASNVLVTDSLVTQNSSELISTAAERVSVQGTYRYSGTGAALIHPFVMEVSVTPAMDSVFPFARRFFPDTLVFLGAGGFVPFANYVGLNSVRQSTTGNVTLFATGTNDTLAGDLVITSGRFVLNNSSIVRKLKTQGTGGLTMTQVGAILTVRDSAIFAGATSAGFLTAGTLRLNGDFVQSAATSTSSFQASGGHVTEFNNTARRSLSMANPGTGAADSRFGRLMLVRAGGPVSVNLLTGVQAAAIVDTSLGVADTLSGTGLSVAADSTGAAGLTGGLRNTVFNGPTLTLSHGTANQALATIVFQNMDPTTTYLSMFRNPSFQVTMNSIQFATPRTSGRYFSGTSAGAGGPGVFSFLTSAAPSFQQALGDYLRLGPTPATVNFNGTPNP